MLIAALSIRLLTCSSTAPAPAAPTPRAPLSIPIEVVNNHVYVKVCVGSRPYEFILDTGAGASYFDLRVARELGLGFGRTYQVGGAGAGTVAGASVVNGRVSLDGTSMTQGVGNALDLSRLPSREAHRIDGILGYDFIARNVLAIDYARRELRLYDRASFTPDSGFTAIPIALAENHPNIQASIRLADGSVVSGRFIVDVGSGVGVSLTKPFVDANHLMTRVGATVTTHSGGGVGGPATMTTGRASALDVGQAELHDVIVHLFGDSAGVLSRKGSWEGNIGGEVLRRFTVYFDYANRRMYLQPNAAADEPFETDMSGLSLSMDTSLTHTVIEDVSPQSPAAEAGLARGDSVVSVDGIPADARGVIDLRLKVKKPGQRIELRIKRRDEERTVVLVTRRLV